MQELHKKKQLYDLLQQENSDWAVNATTEY